MLPRQKSNNIALKKRQSNNFLSPAAAQLCSLEFFQTFGRYAQHTQAQSPLLLHFARVHCEALGAALPC